MDFFNSRTRILAEWTNTFRPWTALFAKGASTAYSLARARASKYLFTLKHGRRMGENLPANAVTQKGNAKESAERRRSVACKENCWESETPPAFLRVNGVSFNSSIK